MRLEKAQHRSGEQANRQKRQNKAERVNCDEQETLCLGTGRAGHQQHTSQRGADTGCPRKAEGEAEQETDPLPSGSDEREFGAPG